MKKNLFLILVLFTSSCFFNKEEKVIANLEKNISQNQKGQITDNTVVNELKSLTVEQLWSYQYEGEQKPEFVKMEIMSRDSLTPNELLYIMYNFSELGEFAAKKILQHPERNLHIIESFVRWDIAGKAKFTPDTSTRLFREWTRLRMENQKTSLQ